MTRWVFVLALTFALVLTAGSTIPDLAARATNSWTNADACIVAYRKLTSVQSTYSSRLMQTAVALGKHATPPYSVASLKSYNSKYVAPAVVAVAAACTRTGDAGPGASPTPSPSPNPSSTPSVADIRGACRGTLIVQAADYAGTVHPLVVVDEITTNPVNKTDPEYSVNLKWVDQSWPSPLQLVVCVGAPQSVGVASCGTYQKTSDGTTGEVLTNRWAQTVRVVIARTGKTLQSETFYGSTPTCADMLQLPGGPPPWKIYGSAVSADAINLCATSVSTQKVQ